MDLNCKSFNIRNYKYIVKLYGQVVFFCLYHFENFNNTLPNSQNIAKSIIRGNIITRGRPNGRK